MEDYNNTYNGENEPVFEKAEETGFLIDTEYADYLPEEEKTEEKAGFAKEAFEWLDVLATAIIAVVVVFSLIFRVATISGESMENTLYSNDKVIITNLAYTPKHGDIVVISRNINNSVESVNEAQVPIIKRVIAVGGQTVDIDFELGVVSVDGVELKEPYTKTLTTRSHDIEFPLYVPEGYIFVLGDNRNDSLDSRSSLIGEGGLVDTRYVLGHAILRIFPFNSIGRLKYE